MLAMVVRPKWVGLCPAEKEKEKVKGTSAVCMSILQLLGLAFAPFFSISQVSTKSPLP